jgi:hypothetical protein
MLTKEFLNHAELNNISLESKTTVTEVQQGRTFTVSRKYRPLVIPPDFDSI